jgi:hypothetical protein
MVVGSQGEKRLIKTVQVEWVRGKRWEKDERRQNQRRAEDKNGRFQQEQQVKQGGENRLGEKVDLQNCQRGRG